MLRCRHVGSGAQSGATVGGFGVQPVVRGGSAVWGARGERTTVRGMALPEDSEGPQDDPLEPRFSFWDCGQSQYVQNLHSGETICVFGVKPVYEDGPFNYLLHEGRPLLVGRRGTDETRALHFADDAFASQLARRPRSEGSPSELCLIPTADDNSYCHFLSDVENDFDPRVLEIALPCGKAFKSEWYRRAVGFTPVGEQLGCTLWVVMPYVMRILCGQDFDSKRICKSQERWRKALVEGGLADGHLQSSVKSVKGKRRRVGTSLTGSEEYGLAGDFSVSVPGLIALLTRWAADERAERYHDSTGLSQMAWSLLGAFTDKVLRGRKVSFGVKPARCVVDVDDGLVLVSEILRSQARNGVPCAERTFVIHYTIGGRALGVLWAQLCPPVNPKSTPSQHHCRRLHVLTWG